VERRPDGFGPAPRTSSERSVGRHGVIADCASVTLIPDPIEGAGTISAQDRTAAALHDQITLALRLCRHGKGLSQRVSRRITCVSCSI
jgi:hypothetical protein